MSFRPADKTVYFSLPTRTFVVVSFIDGDGELCQEVFDDDETAADEFVEDMPEEAKVLVTKIEVA